MSEMTQKEFAKMGNKAFREKYPYEVRSQWAKKGADALKKKYGEDYFKRIAQMRRKKKENSEIEAKLTS